MQAHLMSASKDGIDTRKECAVQRDFCFKLGHQLGQRLRHTRHIAQIRRGHHRPEQGMEITKLTTTGLQSRHRVFKVGWRGVVGDGAKCLTLDLHRQRQGLLQREGCGVVIRRQSAEGPWPGHQQGLRIRRELRLGLDAHATRQLTMATEQLKLG
ncbi:MAG: hypothetical protein ACKODC_05785 [Limnohabitans sp.]